MLSRLDGQGRPQVLQVLLDDDVQLHLEVRVGDLRAAAVALIDSRH